MRFRNGDAEAPLKVVGDADRKGTMVTFLPSTATFKITEFDFDKLEYRFSEIAFLNSGVSMFLTDARHEDTKQVELYDEGDWKSVVWGKSGSGRVDLGGRRMIKTKKCAVRQI